MSVAIPELEQAVDSDAVVLRLPQDLVLTDDQLLEMSSLNSNLRMERSANGDLVIMTPTGGDTGEQNSEINMQLRQWAKRDKTGKTFDSSTGFHLPDSSILSPDASWISLTRLKSVPAEVRKKFIPLCPDFVIELTSPTDRLPRALKKMQEYLENGARLGWLIDPSEFRVYVYRPGKPVEELNRPQQVSGDPELPGFVLDLREIWGEESKDQA